MRQIAKNSNADGGVVVSQRQAGKRSFGFDAASRKYVDLKTTGIIAPTKVVRLALENAVSVAGERLTMKRSTKAALVSLFLPGAGLWYYGRPRLGLINFLIALICPIVGFYAGLIGEHILWMFLAIAAGSAGFSHAMASEPESPE